MTFVKLALAAAVLGGAAFLLLNACEGGAGPLSQERAAGMAAPAPSARALNDSVRGPQDMFFEGQETNPFVATEDDPLSTFAVDVDTGSYTLCRSYLQRGHLPPREAPRVEEFVNAFRYDYPQPDGEVFAIDMALAPSRYGKDIKNSCLLRIGIQAQHIAPKDRKAAVLTFVIDVSGSMRHENRLGLVQRSLHFLVDQLDEDDLVGIAVYGDRGARHLEHTNDRAQVRAAIDALAPGGSTNAEEGIRIGYAMASQVFRPGAINRVILCSDGVANVGRTGPDEILRQVVEQRRQGITLTALGVGMGNYNDHLMEQLGDKGDGHYAYIDDLDEARRVLVDNLTGTLQVVARETKIQVAFDPAVVRSWRLLGYENRAIADEDFRNDRVDGGEVGAGHQVTALYELKLVEDATGPIAKTTVRYKHDEKEDHREITASIDRAAMKTDWQQAPSSLRLAAAAAEFAEALRGSYWAQDSDARALLDDLKQLVAETDDDRTLELAALVQKSRELEKTRDTAEATSR